MQPITPEQEKKIKNVLQKLYLFIFAMLFNVVVIHVLLNYTIKDIAENEKLHHLLQLVAIILTVAATFVSVLLLQNWPRMLASSQSVEQSLLRFLSISILVISLCELAAIIACVAIAFGASNTLMLSFASLAVFSGLLHFPSRQRFLNAHQKAQETKKYNL